MKKIITALLVLLIAKTNAQTFELANTSLWKITGNGLKNDSYIFLAGGTCDEKIKLAPKVQEALKRINIIAVENNLYDDEAAKKMPKLTNAVADSEKVEKVLNATELKSLHDKLLSKGLAEQTIKVYAGFKAGTLFYGLTELEKPCEGEALPDLYELMLKEYAKKNKVQYAVLQNVDNVIEEFYSRPNTYWLQNLRYILRETNGVKADFQTEYGLYKAENIQELKKLYQKNNFYTLQFKDASLKTHVDFISDKMEKLIIEKPSFIAINVSNVLMETNSVFDILTAKGYKISPVNN